MTRPVEADGEEVVVEEGALRADPGSHLDSQQGFGATRGAILQSFAMDWRGRQALGTVHQPRLRDRSETL